MGMPPQHIIMGMPAPHMAIIRLITSLGTLAAIMAAPLQSVAAQEDGVALAIVYDTSGSMKEQVRDRNGNA